MEDKPTLDELFQSKKLDVPDEDFWNGFQDRVKGHAIASLSRRSKTAKIRKSGHLWYCPSFCTFFDWVELGQLCNCTFGDNGFSH